MSMRKERLRTASDQVTIEVRNTGDGATFALTRDDVAGGVMVVGEAGSAVEARDIIRDTRPDLLFLDVEMPEVRGTALDASLPEPRPFIVFATAFETYALDAIAVDAAEKIAELTPDLVLLDIQMPGASGLDVAASLGQPRPRSRHRAGARPGSGTRRAVVRHRSLPHPLSRPSRRLEATTFFQVSRTAIIRLDAVREAKPFADGTGEITLASGTTMVVARRRWRALLERLGA